MNEDDTLFLRVALEGEDVAFQVPALLLEDGDRLIDKVTIVVDDPERAVTDHVREGLTVLVELGWTSLHGVLFEGTVSRVRGFAGRYGQRYVSITAFDKSYLMHRAPRSINHTGALSQIVQTVASAYGLPVGAVTLASDPSFTEEAPLRQSAETDWAFLQRLAQTYGAYAFVEYNDAASRFYFVSAASLLGGEPAGTLRYQDGHGSLLSFSYKREAAHAAPHGQLTTVDPVSGEVAGSTVAPPPPEAPPAPDADHTAHLGQGGEEGVALYNAAAEVCAAAATNPVALRTTTVRAGAPSDPALRAQAGYRDPTREHGWFGTGVTPGMPILRAKSKLALEGVGVWADGEWYVSQARHIVRDGAYHTQFVATR